jgi:hypothetical protein
VSRKLKFLLMALLLAPGLFGCTPIDHGRMGIWARPDFLWASCSCTKPNNENFGRGKNVSFDARDGNPCGGADEKARNAWCGQKCGTVGYAEGAYQMCLM